MSLDLPDIVFGRARADFTILIGYVLDNCIGVPAEEDLVDNMSLTGCSRSYSRILTSLTSPFYHQRWSNT